MSSISSSSDLSRGNWGRFNAWDNIEDLYVLIRTVLDINMTITFKLIQAEEMLLELMKYCLVKLCWAKQIFHMSYDSAVIFMNPSQ
jgi:hypothetical protein